MNREYLIQILLRAREEVSAAAQKAIRALDGVTKAEDRTSEATKRASEANVQQKRTLEELHAAHIREKNDLDSLSASRREEARTLRDSNSRRREQAAVLRESTDSLRRQREEALKAQREALNEATALRDLARARQDQVGKIDKQVKALQSQADASRRIADQNRRLAASFQQSISEIERRARAIDKDVVATERHASALDRDARSAERSSASLLRSLSSVGQRIRRLGDDQERATAQGGRFSRMLGDMGLGSRRTEQNLRALNSTFQGFQLAIIIKYAQSLISALAGLAGTLFSVASAAVQAGAGLVGSLAAGAAQALPIVGLLGAALLRVKNVLQAVKLTNQQQLTASQDAQRAANAQTTATDQVRSAEQALADARRAHERAEQDAARSVKQAQDDLTGARKDAIRTVQDLITAEEEARLKAEGATLSLEQAQASLRRAIRGGDVAGAAQAELDVRQARFGRRQAGVDLTRARQDAAPVRAQGVEGVRQVQDAERRLGDARRQASQQVGDAERQEQRAGEDLNRTRREARRNLAQETAAANKLADTLKQLDPAERQLYRAIIGLQTVYKRVSRPITDIIVGSFTDIVNRITRVIQDPRILNGFRSIAIEVARSVRQVGGEATGGRSISAFQVLSAEAARNIPIATRVLINFFRATRNIVLDAIPAFRLLLSYVEGYSQRALDASRNSRGIRDFFVTGVHYAHSFFELGLAVVRLFLALSGRGGAAEQGIRTINDLTASVDRATHYVNEHSSRVRRFFDQARQATAEVMSVVLALGKAIIGAFSLQSVTTLGEFLKAVIIPALANAVRMLGVLVNAFHALLTLPFVSQVAQWAATVLILAKGLTVIRIAVLEITGILPAFAKAMGIANVATKEMAASGVAAEGAILSLTPAGWVIAAVVALAAAVVLLDRKLHFLAPTLRSVRRVAGDVFDWIKEAAQTVVSFFSDVWTKGLLYWIRWPFVKAFDFLHDRWGVISVGAKDNPVTGPAVRAIEFFADNWRSVWRLLRWPFDRFIDFLGGAWKVISNMIVAGLDVVRGDFTSAGHRIASAWETIFNGIYDTVVDILNLIIKGVNVAISGLSKLPGVEIGKLKLVPTRKERAQQQALSAHQQNLGQTGHLAEGAMVDARPGGRLFRVVEGGYDEVVLTTDPRHKERQQALLGEYLRRAPHVVGLQRGGFIPLPGTDFAYGDEPKIVGALRKLSGLIHETIYGISGYRTAAHSVAVGGFANDPHTRGQAADIGAGAPTKASMFHVAEALLRRVGLYRPYYPPSRSEVNHVELLRSLSRAARSSLAAAGLMHGGAGMAVVVPGVDTYLRGLEHDPSRRIGGALRAATHSLWRTARGGVRRLYDDTVTGANTLGGLPAGVGGAGPAQARRWAMSGLQAAGVPSTAHNIALIVGRMGQESSFNEKAINLWDVNAQRGTPTKGLMQLLQSNFERFWVRGTRHDIFDPIANVAAAVRYMLATYGYLIGRSPTGAGYATGGAVPGYGGGDRWPIWAEGGEHLWSKEEVARAGGHGVMRALRRVFGAGAQGGPEGYQLGGAAFIPFGRPRLGGGLAAHFPEAALAEVNAFFVSISETLERVARGPLRRSKNLAARIRRAFETLTEDGGVLDQLHDAVERVATQGALRLQRAQFRVGPGGATRALTTPAQQAQAQIGVLQDARRALAGERGDIAQALVGARRAASEARRRGDNKALVAANAAVENLHKRLDDNTTALAQNAQDQVEAVEGLQQAMTEAVNAAAERNSTAIDRAVRFAKALGRQLDPNAVLNQQIGNMRGQIAGLQAVLAEARRTGNADLANTITDQIAELDTAIAEAVAQRFQNSVDAVNQAAQERLTANERRQRRAQIGRTDYAALGAALVERGGVLQQQRGGLAALLAQAQAAGNIDQIKSLTDQIDELDTSIQENTQAVQDNTDAAFNAATQQINDAAGFAQSVFSGAQQFFQGLTTLTGQPTATQQLGALQGLGGALATQQHGLAGQLGSLLGYTPEEVAHLQQLSGADLVNYLLSISSGPVLENIMARLDPTQQAAFRELVTALIGNATATEQNTQAINDLTGQDTQSFSSSFWQSFRTAVFTGAGGLLPQYASLVPTAQAGARVMASGVLMVHSGEDVRPAHVVRAESGSRGGDTYNTYLTSPTEVLNPSDVGRQLAFERNVRSR